MNLQPPTLMVAAQAAHTRHEDVSDTWMLAALAAHTPNLYPGPQRARQTCYTWSQWSIPRLLSIWGSLYRRDKHSHTAS